MRDISSTPYRGLVSPSPLNIGPVKVSHSGYHCEGARYAEDYDVISVTAEAPDCSSSGGSQPLDLRCEAAVKSDRCGQVSDAHRMPPPTVSTGTDVPKVEMLASDQIKYTAGYGTGTLVPKQTVSAPVPKQIVSSHVPREGTNTLIPKQTVSAPVPKQIASSHVPREGTSTLAPKQTVSAPVPRQKLSVNVPREVIAKPRNRHRQMTTSDQSIANTPTPIETTGIPANSLKGKIEL